MIQDKIKLEYTIPETVDKKAEDLIREVHLAISKITSDIENEFQFNTVVSKYRELTNAIYDYIKDEETINYDVFHEQKWPVADMAKTKQNNILLIVQVNGKIWDKIETASGQTNDELTKLALNSEKTKQFIEGKTVIKTIVVPDKIVNIVVK